MWFQFFLFLKCAYKNNALWCLLFNGFRCFGSHLVCMWMEIYAYIFLFLFSHFDPIFFLFIQFVRWIFVIDSISDCHHKYAWFKTKNNFTDFDINKVFCLWNTFCCLVLFFFLFIWKPMSIIYSSGTTHTVFFSSTFCDAVY